MTWMSKSRCLSTFAVLMVITALLYCVGLGKLTPTGVAKLWNIPSVQEGDLIKENLIQPAAQAERSKVNCDSLGALPYQARRNFTIVTAFLKIGTFQKGNGKVTRGPSTYVDWMWPYGLILNGVVAYFDDAEFAATFAQVRKNRPTKVIMVDRSQLWAFSNLNRTSTVFMQADYPKNHPKSTSAEYVAAMHAKYELVARAAQRDDPFGSNYIAWMDLGIYRELSKDSTEEFMLVVHGCHRDEAILFSRVFPMSKDYTLQSVMRNGNDWVGGGFFVARHEVAIRFYADYARSVESYLNQSLANHDQSVLLAMYLPTTVPRPAVSLQAIIPSGPGDIWFYLAMQARTVGLAKPNTSACAAECSYHIHF